MKKQREETVPENVEERAAAEAESGEQTEITEEQKQEE